jgi:hypothetical protein
MVIETPLGKHKDAVRNGVAGIEAMVRSSLKALGNGDIKRAQAGLLLMRLHLRKIESSMCAYSGYAKDAAEMCLELLRDARDERDEDALRNRHSR